MQVNTNIPFQIAQKHQQHSMARLEGNMERLSTGLRVNDARDDASGIAIGGRMEAVVRAADSATRGLNDGISMIETAESSLDGVEDLLHRAREMAVQASSDTLSDTERAALDKEYRQLREQIDTIAYHTKIFGQYPLLWGEAKTAGADGQVSEAPAAQGSASTFFVNASSNFGRSISQIPIDYTPSDHVSLGLRDTALDPAEAARQAISDFDTAIDQVSSYRGQYGAAQNRLEGAIEVASAEKVSKAAAHSRLMDTDYAAETADWVKNQILREAGTAMVTQTAKAPADIMTLLE